MRTSFLKRITLIRPERRAVLRLLLGGGALVFATLAAIGWERLRLQDVDWVTSAARYIGLIVASALGVVGTATDTKKLASDGSYTLRPIGWIVVTAIVMALLIGAVGQYYEDTAKRVADERQLRRLEALTALARQTLKRFSGKLAADVSLELPEDQPLLHEIADAYDKKYRAFPNVKIELVSARPDGSKLESIVRHYQDVISQTACHVSVTVPGPPGRPVKSLMELELAATTPADVRELLFDPRRRMVCAVVHLTSLELINSGIYSASDFEGRRVTVTYKDLVSNAHPHSGYSAIRGKLHADVKDLRLFDSELQTEMATARLTRHAWVEESFFDQTTATAHVEFTGITSPNDMQ